MFVPEPGYANPQGGVVTSGKVTISTPSANSMEIRQTTNKSIINWQSYNIGAKQQVNYTQPNRSSISLNKINPAQGVSQIYGKLTSNGQVWLINPAGIFFGPTAYVNVAGLVASTASISDQDFLRGFYHFANVPGYNGAVINQGQIIAANHGLIALIGGAVSNEGLIEADLGQVALASGNSFTMSFAGNDLVGFSVDAGITQQAVDNTGKRMANGVSNSGKVIANGGKILMTSDQVTDVLNNSVNVSGLVMAQTVSKSGGEIIISGSPNSGVVNISGTLDASGTKPGTKGGNISVTGDIFVLSGSRRDQCER